jgi:hypothetical protein
MNEERSVMFAKALLLPDVPLMASRPRGMPLHNRRPSCPAA